MRERRLRAYFWVVVIHFVVATPYTIWLHLLIASPASLSEVAWMVAAVAAAAATTAGVAAGLRWGLHRPLNQRGPIRLVVGSFIAAVLLFCITLIGIEVLGSFLPFGSISMNPGLFYPPVGLYCMRKYRLEHLAASVQQRESGSTMRPQAP